MAVCTRQHTGNHTRPASREARCRAAVIQRPSRMSHERPARLWRAVRGQGVLPLEGFGEAVEAGNDAETGAAVNLLGEVGFAGEERAELRALGHEFPHEQVE